MKKNGVLLNMKTFFAKRLFNWKKGLIFKYNLKFKRYGKRQ